MAKIDRKEGEGLLACCAEWISRTRIGRKLRDLQSEQFNWQQVEATVHWFPLSRTEEDYLPLVEFGRREREGLDLDTGSYKLKVAHCQG